MTGGRTPYDGLPYYCADCGAGFREWKACSYLECGLLEPIEDAQARADLRAALGAALEATAKHKPATTPPAPQDAPKKDDANA